LHALVNKFIRNKISTQEKFLPFEEARSHEENAQKAAATDYDDSTFNLLFKDELQEKEFARVLLEHGNKKWNEGVVAEFMLEEILDEGLFDNADVLKLINEYKKALGKEHGIPDKNLFVYSNDPAISSFAVSLLNFPYEASEHWKREFSSSTGYQKKLFEQSYEDFLRSITVGNETELMTFLKMDEDKTHIEVESALSYLKLKKIKRMLLENQVDLEKKHTPEEYRTLAQTHEHLKQMEREISGKLGAVIIK
jgi:DNA primase